MVYVLKVFVFIDIDFGVDPTGSVWYIFSVNSRRARSISELTPQGQYGIILITFCL